MLSKVMEKKYQEYIKDIITNQISYKMEKNNFKMWLSYLKSNPVKATYQGFVEFKKQSKGGF